MPKRGGSRNNRNSRNDRSDDDFEHDDRGGGTRRVWFKAGTNKGKNKFRVFQNDPSLLLDDDIDMGATSMRGGRDGYNQRGRRGRYNTPTPRGGPGMQRKKFIVGHLPWYQIIIPYGAKHEKDVVLKALLSYISPIPIIPHYYKINGNAAIFYVEDVKTAEALFNADKQIVMSDGFKLVVIVKNAVPNVTVDDEMKEKMKLTMAKRYNAATKALDLTKFHCDSDLTDLFCVLFRPMIMLAAIDIIAENIPDLEALNLNDNKLHGLDHLKVLPSKLRKLKILYLGDNKIPYLGSLESLKLLPLVELYLKGNPLVNKFQDHEIYIRCIQKAQDRLCERVRRHTANAGQVTFRELYRPENSQQILQQITCIFLHCNDHVSPTDCDVRKKFPKLVKLDGADLPPSIGFDVADDVKLPPRQQSFLVDPAGQDLVREFLTQYFAIFDSESRQPLLEAYHEQATMSMAANYLSYDGRNSSGLRLNAYLTNSCRNLLRVRERDARRKYLRTGRLQVVSFLSDLPKTTHDMMGFAVDLLVFTPTMIVLTMNGVYRETSTAEKATRSFHRTFVITPNSAGGFSIVHDMLFVTNTSKEQEDKAFATGGLAPVAAAPMAPVAPLAPAAPIAAAAPTAALDDTHKQQAMLLLGQQTGMNQHWSMNCLQETGWDLQRALFIFNQLQTEGKIPAEAFK